MKKILLTLFSLALLGIFSHCKKKSADIQPGSFTALPVDMSNITGLVPLGALNPPSHTFPTDHMYFYFTKNVPSFDISSPGNLHVVQLVRQRKNWGQASQTEDYSIIMVAGSTKIRFAHITQLQGKLQGISFSASGCETKVTGSDTYEKCSVTVDVNVLAGDLIGKVYTNIQGQNAFDLGIYVNGIPVCPLDYFDNATRTALVAKLGNADGSIKRTAEPLCGEVNQDNAGSLQGNWVQNGFSWFDESKNISFAKDVVQPERLFLSIGDSGSNLLPPGLYEVVAIQSAGLVDRAFKDVKPDGKIYAYNVKVYESGIAKERTVFVKLEDKTNLSLEVKDGNVASQPSPFSFSVKKTYHR